MSLFRMMSLRNLIKFSIRLSLVCAICILAGTFWVSAERIPTALTLGILPEDPTINQSFHITGQLKTLSSEPLGNKRIILESSLKGAQDSEGFSFIGTEETTRSGDYEFFRPKGSPPEFIRVRFAGNSEYEATTSPVIAVRGAGTDHPQIHSGGSGSVMISTDPEGADIYVDKVLRGVTPNKIAGLSEGSHILEVSKPGYQNETMEAYVTSERDASFGITLSEEGLGRTSTGLSSGLSFNQNVTEPKGDPDFALDLSGTSMKIYGNDTAASDLSFRNNTPKTTNYKDLKVSTLVTNNTLLGDGYDIMVIMTDH